MRILIPDTQFDGEPLVEAAAFDGKAQFDVHYAKTRQDIPEEVWRAADGILLWHIMDIDRDVVSLLDNCKVVARNGIGYDRINPDRIEIENLLGSRFGTHEAFVGKFALFPQVFIQYFGPT